MKTGLVLEGGAMRGMFTAGVLDSWMDEQISFDGIVGVSAGALFGINAPAGQKGRAIRYNLKYIRDKRYMGLRSLLTTGNLINADFAFYEVSSKLDVFDEAAFQRSGVDFYAAVTDLHTGAPEYIRITEPFRQMEVLRATSAMPYVSRPVELDGRFYLDGGVSDSIPVHFCKSLGYDKTVLVLTRPLEYRKERPAAWLQRFNRLYYHRYPAFAESLNRRWEVYNRQVEEIIGMEQRGELFVVRPNGPLPIRRVEKDPAKLQAVYDLGAEAGRASLSGLKEYLLTHECHLQPRYVSRPIPLSYRHPSTH